MKLIRLIGKCFVSFLFAGFLFAEPWSPEPISLRLKIPIDAPSLSLVKDQWRSSCQNLMDSFQIGVGPWGFGIFAGYACYLNQELISGYPGVGTLGAEIVIEQKKAGEGFSVVMSTKLASATTPVAPIFALPPSENFFVAFSDRSFADLFAYTFLDTLPASMVINKTEVLTTRKKQVVCGRPSREGGRFLVPNPPESMNVLELDLAKPKASQRQKPVGMMSFLGYRIAGKGSDVPSSKNQTEEISTPIWESSTNIAPASKGKFTLAQNQSGPGMMFKGLSASTVAAYSFLANGEKPTQPNLLVISQSANADDKQNQNLLAQFPLKSSVKYGFSLIKDSAMLKTSKFLILDAENRRSKLQSFVFLYELLERVKSKESLVDGSAQNMSFRMGKFSFLWRFDLDVARFTKAIVDTLSLGPRIAAVNLSFARISSNGTSDQFELAREMSLGWEVGISKKIGRFTLKGSINADAAGFISRFSDTATESVAGKSASASNLRYAALLDFLLKKIPTKKSELKISTQAFAFHESLKMTREHVEKTTDSKFAALNIAYFGIGAGLEW